jgi:hypothetical protein
MWNMFSITEKRKHDEVVCAFDTRSQRTAKDTIVCSTAFQSYILLFPESQNTSGGPEERGHASASYVF